MPGQVINWQNDLEEFKNQIIDILFIKDHWSEETTSNLSYKQLIQDLFSYDMKIYQSLYTYLVKENITTNFKPQIDHHLAKIPEDFIFLPLSEFKAKMNLLWKNSSLEIEDWTKIFVKNREELIQLFQTVFIKGTLKIKQHSNQLLNESLSITRTNYETYFFGTQSNLNIIGLQTLFSKIDMIISLDLFKTFLNAIHLLEEQRILQIGYNVGYYLYCTWFSGIETTVASDNQTVLMNLYENIKIYQDLLKAMLISPFNEKNIIPKVILIKDQLPDLKRFNILELHSYSGIIINLAFSYLDITNFAIFILRIKELITKNGYIIINEFDIDKETISTIKEFMYTENMNILLNSRKNSLNIENSTTSLSTLLENGFLQNGFKLLLRTRHFDNLPYIGWLFKYEE